MAAIRLPIIVFESFRDRGKLGLPLLSRHTGFEKCVTFNPARAAIFEFVAGTVEGFLHRRRHPKVERVADKRAVKFLPRDANDRVLNSVKILRFANDIRIAFVTVLPRQVTNHRDRVRVSAAALFRSKSAAQNRSNPERVEIIRGNNSTARAFGAIADTQRCARDFIDDKRLEQSRVFFEIEEVGVRNSCVTLNAAGRGVEGKHSILMRDERVRPNEYSFDPTENRRHSADAERQTKNCQNGKAGTAAKHSEAEAKVLEKRLH